jgi:signal peptidase I
MSKKQPPSPSVLHDAGTPAVGVTDAKKGPPQGASRETCESIAFAFVLALLFRTFAAEAFVIPTGSMAPTLLGRNKDVTCPTCGHQYKIGASDELDEDTGTYLVGSRRIDASLCENCRNLHDVKPLNVFTGDRILVNKSAYQFGQPSRWDVIVFRYPEDTQKNYIKRLVGLPHESLRIERGDVYSRRSDKDPFQITRKQDPDKQKLLQQMVFDDRHPPLNLIEHGWPESWRSVEKTGTAAGVDGWTIDPNGWSRQLKTRRLELQSSEKLKWIRYQHFVPTEADWGAVENNTPPTANPRPQLIADFCGYNTYTGGRSSGTDDDRYWVGDLTMSCKATIGAFTGSQSFILLELVEGVRRYRCRIDLPSGQATLTRNDDLAADPETATDIVLARAATSITGSGTYTLKFANVDDRLCLWVNDSWWRSGLIPFGDGAEFEPPANRNPQDVDLTPAGIAAQGVSLQISDLQIERDIYYRADSVTNNAGTFTGHGSEVDERVPLHDYLDNPQVWGEMYQSKSKPADFTQLGPDEFFVMGDNSPRSQDSRLWPNQIRHAVNRHAVSRQALIGKAFFVYWPHGIPFLNGGRGFMLKGHSPAPQFIDKNSPDWVRKQVAEEQLAAANYPKYVAPFYPQWWRWKRIR